MRGIAPIIAFLTVSHFSLAMRQSSGIWTPPGEPVYVVLPNVSSEGSTTASTKSGDLLMIQIYPAMRPSSDNADLVGGRLYPRGRTIALYVDGQRRGDVRIETVKEHHCNSVAASVAPTLTTVSKRVTGLATNAPGIRSRSTTRRDANTSERISALRLATRELVSNKVSTALMTRIRPGELKALQVDGSQTRTLVGSFFIQTKTERHDIFVIARVDGEKTSLEYSRYGQTMDLEDFKDHESIGLIDHLDLNQDGTDEIVLVVYGYESERYDIYSRRNGKWEPVASGGEAGC